MQDDKVIGVSNNGWFPSLSTDEKRECCCHCLF
jgi:hypothetical protein